VSRVLGSGVGFHALFRPLPWPTALRLGRRGRGRGARAVKSNCPLRAWGAGARALRRPAALPLAKAATCTHRAAC